MTYEECLEFLFAQLPIFQRQGAAAYKKDLSNTIKLLDYLGNPQNDLTTIHVAGTNGKGSISHMLASVFQQHGYKTGLHTSPHLTDFRERIKLNSEKCKKPFVTDFINKHKDYILQLQPSFFELTVAMAFEYFKINKTQIAIIEVGMGGRLDSTNVLSPILSIISNIGWDHQQFLGNTIPLIAAEKAGIIKDNTPVIIGKHQIETTAIFTEKAANCNSTITWADDFFKDCKIDKKEIGFNISISYAHQQFNIDFPLSGSYQIENLKTVLVACLELQKKYQLQTDVICKAISNFDKYTGLRGRWEQLSNNPLVICEVAHNEMGIKALIADISTKKYRKIHVIFGMVNDKDYKKILSLLPTSYHYLFCQANIPRALDYQELASTANSLNLKGTAYASVEKAIIAAKEMAQAEDLILITGSIFIVADAIAYFDKQ